MTKTTKKISLIMCCFFGFALSCADGAEAAAGVTAKENLEKLLKTKSCKGCDLSGLNLTRMDLAGVNLDGADLSFSKLSLANLAGASLQNCILTGAKLGGADLGDVDLRGADLRGASLDGAYLGGAQIDGEFVTAEPFEKLGISDVEKEVYVEDQAKPKKYPAKQEVQVGSRRDFEEPPPQLEEKQGDKIKPVTESIQTQVVEVAPKEMVLPKPPAAKNIKPVSPVVVEESKSSSAAKETVKEESKVTVAAAQAEKKIDQEKDVKQVETMPLNGKVPSDEVIEVAKSTSDVPIKEDVGEGVVDKNPEIGGLSTDLARDKKKRDNLSRLLDRNRCYGCDLSGLDLSKKDLEKADLEKADLTGCNLAGADLENANLKGAVLQNADIRNADLRKTDFYKADLTGADLTGSKMTEALFDGAILEGSQGINSHLMITN